MQRQLIDRKKLEKKYPTKRQAIDFLNFVFIAQVGYDVAERLEGSPFDVKGCKMHLNGFKQHTARHEAVTCELFNIDRKSMQIAYNEAGNLLNGVFKLDPEEWQYIEGLRKLLADKPNESITTQIKALILNANS